MIVRRDGAKTALAIAGFVVSLVCVAYFALILVAFGFVYVDGFMSWEPTPALKILGYGLFALGLFVMVIAVRAHIIAVRYLVGRSIAPTAVTSASGALPALIGSQFLSAYILEQCHEAVIIFLPLLPIAVIAAWGCVAFRR